MRDREKKTNDENNNSLNHAVLFVALFVFLVGATLYLYPIFFPVKYISDAGVAKDVVATPVEEVIPLPPKRIVRHFTTPKPLKAIYMTSWVAGRSDLRSNLVKLIDETELNAVVIDIKDYSGKVSFYTDNAVINSEEASERRIADIKEFIDLLHEKNIYVIGRISVFQDSHMVARHPEWAVKRSSDGGVWKDYKGISWIEAGAEPFWEYILEISKYSYYEIGFDELNFDYIRFPSDGNMKDIAYAYSAGRTKAQVLKDFFVYLHTNLKNDTSMYALSTTTELATTTPHIPILSADLFGMTTSNTDDLNIGQLLENALPYFDYIAPMVYPSHYPTNFIGLTNPSAHPYEVIKFAMGKAVERTVAASTTPDKMRPWLQDFSIGKTHYTPQMVREQIQATYDVGLDSWMLWSASNRYSTEALIK